MIMRQFDLFEYLENIVPGALFLTGLWLLAPGARQALHLDNLNWGEIGVGIILAYALGWVLQGLGNPLADIYWDWQWHRWEKKNEFRWDGKAGQTPRIPSDWLVSIPGRLGLLSDAYQLPRLEEKLQGLVKVNDFKLTSQDLDQWRPLVGEMHAAVIKADRGARVEVFNAYYGLSRGLAAGSFCLLIVSVIAHRWNIPLHCLILFILWLATERLRYFGRRYVQELIVQFLQL